jgi:hypothetical protein
VIAPNKLPIFIIVFVAAYAALYTVCTEVNLPVLTYHPVLREIDFLRAPQKRGPTMYWYGWMLTAGGGALVIAWIATVVPERWVQRTIMLGCLGAVAYLILYTIAPFVSDMAPVAASEFLKSRAPSVIAALAVAAVASYFAPARWTQRVWPGWVWLVPIGSLSVLGYYLSSYFTR